MPGQHADGASVIKVGSIARAGNGIDGGRRCGATPPFPRGQCVHSREIEISLQHEGTH